MLQNAAASLSAGASALRIAVLAAALTCVLPGLAGAATVEKAGSELVYRSGDLASSLSVDWDPYGAEPRITFIELGDYPNAVLTPGPGCDRGNRPNDQYFASCRIDGIRQIRLEGEGGNDSMGPYSWLPLQFKLVSRGGPGNDGLTDRASAAADSVFDGGPGSDSIVAYAGDDTVTGGPTDASDLGDSLIPGDGADTVYGGAGDDTIPADATYDPAFGDRLYGQSGNDSIDGGYGTDRINGGKGNDLLYGDAGADQIFGEAGHDAIEPDPRSSDLELSHYTGDAISGGTGTDTVAFPYRSQQMTLSLDGVANDGITGEADNLDVDRSVENLKPGSGTNDITLDDKDNSVTNSQGDWSFGPGGDDTIRARGGNDTIWTGTGDDVVDGGAGNDEIRDGGEHDRLSGGEGDDRLIGNSTADEFDPGPGRDEVFGSDGYDDVVTAADGEYDEIACGDYDEDTVEADAGDLLLDCETVARLNGRVGVVGGVLDVRATGGVPNTLTVKPLTATTFEVRDVRPLDAQAGCVQMTANVARCTGPTSARIDAGDHHDTVTVSGTLATTILGGSGNDTLTGGSGADVLDGGPGGDVLAGGARTDTVTYASRTGGVTVDIDGVRDDGSSVDHATVTLRDNVQPDVENLIGGASNDRLTGSSAANVIDGGLGGDVISGLQGVDTATYESRTIGVTVDNDGVRDDGSAEDGRVVSGRDNVQADVENLTGGAGGDLLVAISPVANLLSGLDGDDRLKTRDGGGTADRLLCAAGADQFDSDAADTRSGCETPATL